MSEIKNAKITSTRLGREDHGILTFYIFIEFGGAACGIGGYALDSYDKEKKCRIYSTKSIEAIAKILDIVGVNTWEELSGSYIRIKYNGLSKPVCEIGNLMEEKWFNIKEFFEEQ